VGVFIALVILCRVLGIAVATRGALISPWMPQGGQRAMPLMGSRDHVKRERDRRTAGRAVRKRGMGILTKSTSSGEGDTD
jgi:hypothetical protein